MLTEFLLLKQYVHPHLLGAKQRIRQETPLRRGFLPFATMVNGYSAAGGCAVPFTLARGPTAEGTRLVATALIESAKSEMRGTISARKREPLNTP